MAVTTRSIKYFYNSVNCFLIHDCHFIWDNKLIATQYIDEYWSTFYFRRRQLCTCCYLKLNTNFILILMDPIFCIILFLELFPQ
jgi:hypothetical protein